MNLLFPTVRAIIIPAMRLVTERLLLREVTHDDAPFIFELVNEPSWLRFIGDKNVHSLADARRYIDDGPRRSYAQHGFGLYLTERQGTPLGLCGLVKRDTLPDVDLGFAFLPRHQGHGYAREAAEAVLGQARALALPRLLAICTTDNAPSIKLLTRVGFAFERPFEDLSVYAMTL